MAFNQFTTLEKFENCIRNNEIPSDQIPEAVDRMTFPEEVSNLNFLLLNFTDG